MSHLSHAAREWWEREQWEPHVGASLSNGRKNFLQTWWTKIFNVGAKINCTKIGYKQHPLLVLSASYVGPPTQPV